MISRIFSTIFLLFLFSNSVFAQILDSSFYEWTVYEIFDDKKREKKCYMINYPEKSDSDHNFRDLPYIAITRYQNRRIEEFSAYSGFEYKINYELPIAIDDKKFLLATNNDLAWTNNKIEDAILIQKMLRSSILKIRADSSIGTFAIDEYSLKGITKAYSRLKKICD